MVGYKNKALTSSPETFDYDCVGSEFVDLSAFTISSPIATTYGTLTGVSFSLSTYEVAQTGVTLTISFTLSRNLEEDVGSGIS